MQNRTFLAYSVAGVAAALAITVISASAFDGGEPTSDGSSGAAAAPAAVSADGAPIEYVYVDAPVGDDWDGEDHEDHEDHEDDDHDDERGGLLGWLTGGEHDDDD